MLLPLFPLHTVLFPGMPLTLHIFEERYRMMISRCIAEQSPFGVVLIRSGSEVEGFGPAAEPYRIGCTATITQVQKTELGRINLIAVGQQRFEILSFDRSQPYLQATVNFLPTGIAEGQPTASFSGLRPNVRRYLQSVAQAERIDFEPAELPDDPLELAYLGASVLKLPLPDKQALLETSDATTLIERVTSLFRKELALFQILNQSKTPEGGLFSLN